MDLGLAQLRDRSHLSVSYNKVGNVQSAQGDLAGALKSYRDSAPGGRFSRGRRLRVSIRGD